MKTFIFIGAASEASDPIYLRPFISSSSKAERSYVFTFIKTNCNGGFAAESALNVRRTTQGGGEEEEEEDDEL